MKGTRKLLEKAYFSIKRNLRFPPKDERVHFNVQTLYDGHVQITYRGIPAGRCPFDYVMYQMIINDLKPDLVLEIGTSKGGTSLYIADIMNILGHGVIHTVDLASNCRDIVSNHPRIKLFNGGWQSYDIANTKNFPKILVIEDASHMYEDSIGCLKKFSPIVSVGSYYIVEDGIINNLGREEGFHGGPLRAIREFLKSNNDFIVDRKYCDMFGKNATFNVSGYLKRIK